MSKKNKTIEVSIRNVQDGAKNITEVLVGKNVVGQVIDDQGKFQAVINEEPFRAQSVDDGIELVLRQYNLHN